MLPKLSRYGGVEGFAWRLAEELAKKYAVDFICSRQNTQAPEGVRVVCIGRPCMGKSIKILWFALGAEWVRRRNNYDLSIGLGNTVYQDILRISGGPTKIFWKHSKKAYPKGFSRTWKMIRRRLTPANRLVLLIERLQVRHTRTLIANSHLVRTWLFEAFPQLKKKTVRIIYNKADLKKFSPCSAAEKNAIRKHLHLPDKVIIATAATNFILKGIRPLIETLPFLPENHILLIAGGRNAARYNRIARRLGITERVYFMGKVDDMPSFYRASDLFILLTFYDACSNAILEALATGLPVISTDTNGSSKFLAPQNILNADSRPQDIAATIQRAMSNGQQPSIYLPLDAEAGIPPYTKLVANLLRMKQQKITE